MLLPEIVTVSVRVGLPPGCVTRPSVFLPLIHQSIQSALSDCLLCAVHLLTIRKITRTRKAEEASAGRQGFPSNRRK